jgi:hypothetical protein
VTSGAEARILNRIFTARLKPHPFKNDFTTYVFRGEFFKNLQEKRGTAFGRALSIWPEREGLCEPEVKTG